MKILIVCGRLYIGGAEKVAYSLGHYRDRNKYECHYLVFGEEIGIYEEELVNDGCKIIHMNVPADSYKVFWENLNELLKREKYDVIHCHTMFNSGIVLSAAKKNKVPVRIAHSHSICSSPNRKVTKKIYERVMRYLIIRNATDYVACGVAAGEWLYGKKVFEKHGRLVYNGIDIRMFVYNNENRNRIREELYLDNRFVIGHVGHLADVKNQSFLIKLMPEIIAKIPNAVLLLLGEGNDRPMLEKLISDMKLNDYVIMTGNVMNVQDYLSAMDVFAFPSLYEGMPLSIIEVQANGLPCVISDAVPEDVFLSDLLTKISLSDREKWINTITEAKRSNPEKYNDIMYNTGFDTHVMLEKIYNIYDKNTNK